MFFQELATFNEIILGKNQTQAIKEMLLRSNI